MFFFCCGPAQTLTHSLWAGAISARPDGVFFFCCGPAGSFLVSLKRPGGAAAKKKTPRGGVFFCCGPARTLTHSLRAWVVPSPRRGGVFFFFSAAPPGRGGVFFLLWPRPDAHSLTVGWGDFGKAGGCIFFCCGPAGSFLVSLKRPGGAAAKKKNTTGRCFFFLLRPRADAHSLTAGLGGAFPSPGWCFFFCCGPARTGVVFFFLLWPRPDAHSLTVGWGDFGKVRGVFFFLLWPRLVFLGNSKKCLVYYIGSKKTRRGHNKKKTPLPDYSTNLLY